tara:strand:- start:1743 stop:1952 length:210 start_codon:yes stop_codon:yes gene_type:complete
MNKELLNALYTFYEGNIAKAQANLRVYLDNPAGIGEHPDVIEAMDSQVSIIVENQDKRDAVQLLLENIK